MIKSVIYLLIGIMGGLVIGKFLNTKEIELPKSNKVYVILYQKWKKPKILDDQSPYFQELFQECERLLSTANDTYLLIVTKDLIKEMKKKDAIEVIYPVVKVVKIPFKSQPLYFTRLLIPLKGEFANGTIFFAGRYEYILKRDTPDLIPEQNYNYIDVYGGCVVNTQGINRLKEILKNRLKSIR